MSLLQNSNRCHLFEEIASEIWHEVIASHSVRVQVSEVGTTNRIVSSIRLSELSNPNIGIWANQGFNEINHGSDMDVFVETRPGWFIWWALQAKVLRLGRVYEGITELHRNEFQWAKLNRLSLNAGCFSRYLFYNGVANERHNGNDICDREFEQDQFGCSLVEIADVERVALAGVPRFGDFHPALAQPWRIIPCCLISTLRDDITYYSAAQIRRSLDYYPELTVDRPDILEIESPEPPNSLPDDAISNFSKEASWDPAYRMVIRTTNSLTAE